MNWIRIVAMNTKLMMSGMCLVLAACAAPGWRAPPTEADFAAVKSDMPSQEVLVRLGRPTYTFSVPWQNVNVWNYRLIGGDCVVFQVVITQAGRVRESNSIWDPKCDGPADRV